MTTAQSMRLHTLLYCTALALSTSTLYQACKRTPVVVDGEAARRSTTPPIDLHGLLLLICSAALLLLCTLHGAARNQSDGDLCHLHLQPHRGRRRRTSTTVPEASHCGTVPVPHRALPSVVRCRNSRAVIAAQGQPLCRRASLPFAEPPNSPGMRIGTVHTVPLRGPPKELPDSWERHHPRILQSEHRHSQPSCYNRPPCLLPCRVLLWLLFASLFSEPLFWILGFLGCLVLVARKHRQEECSCLVQSAHCSPRHYIYTVTHALIKHRSPRSSRINPSDPSAAAPPWIS
ncbi:hypothetical protein F5884DRAFT_65381 [Xylogone sp. PMI_703]|nr:hypothetical protein F5884DRAFT_65381 [Xylogone sp. PMI_703]